MPAFAADSDEVSAVEEKRIFSAGGQVDFDSIYIWRGIKLSDGPVMQPSAWIEAYGAKFTVWSNFAFDDDTDNLR